jgi:hypothetical protein
LEAADGDDDHYDGDYDYQDIFMNLEPSMLQIVPTLEGFKQQISALGPRLEPALVQRYARILMLMVEMRFLVHLPMAILVSSTSC